MDTTNFNQLMNGEDAKWLHDPLGKTNGTVHDLFKNAMGKQHLNEEEKDELRKEIQSRQTSIPQDVAQRIQKAVAKWRASGVREDRIRKLVMKKFKITVI